MFNANEEAVKAEDKYRRELLRDQNQTSGHTRKGAQAVLVAVALAVVPAACGIPTQNETGAIEAPSQIDNGIVTDPGPSWQPNSGVAGAGPVVAVLEFGGMAAPSWQPSAGKLAEVLPDHGVFAGPNWQPYTTALEEALGIDTDVFTGPSHQPDYGKLESFLNTEHSTPASGPR